MKAVRSHDYRIDGYGNVKFIKSISATDIRLSRFFGGEKEQKTEPGLDGCKNAKSQRKSSRSFSAKRLAPWKTGTMSTTTTTRGWSRRKGSTHEIYPLSTRRAPHPTVRSPRGRRPDGPCRPRRIGSRFFPELVTHHTPEARLAAID
jgi:hypothetical protein